MPPTRSCVIGRATDRTRHRSVAPLIGRATGRSGRAPPHKPRLRTTPASRGASRRFRSHPTDRPRPQKKRLSPSPKDGLRERRLMRRRERRGPENQRGSLANGPAGLLNALAPFFGPVTRGALALGAASPAGSGAAAAGLAGAAGALSAGTTLVAFGGVFPTSVGPPGCGVEGTTGAAGGAFVSEQPEAMTTAATASVSQQE